MQNFPANRVNATQSNQNWDGGNGGVCAAGDGGWDGMGFKILHVNLASKSLDKLS